MDYLSIIKQPILKDLDDFIALFNQSLTHEDGMLGSALGHIRQREPKTLYAEVPNLLLNFASHH